jgi:hypothetical protein
LQRWRKQISEGTLLRDRFAARERQQAKELDWYKKKVAEQAMECPGAESNRHVLTYDGF